MPSFLYSSGFVRKSVCFNMILCCILQVFCTNEDEPTIVDNVFSGANSTLYTQISLAGKRVEIMENVYVMCYNEKNSFLRKEGRGVTLKKKKLLAATLICGLLAAPTASFAREVHVDGDTLYSYVNDNGAQNDALDKPVTMHVDGRFIASDVTPTIRSGRTLVPLRAAGEALDAEITWDQGTQTATAVKDGNIVKFHLNDPVYTVNGETRYADVPTMLINDRTMLPLRALGEALNAEVVWDQEMYDVAIDTAAVDAPKPNIPAGVPESVATMVEKFYVPSDVSDPFFGSWHKTYTQSDPYTGGTSVTNEFIFVTPYNDGYHCIEMSATSNSAKSYVQYVTYRDPAGRCENKSTNLYVMSIENMYYVFDFGRGGSANHNYYTASDNSLQLIGWYNAFQQLYFPVTEYEDTVPSLLLHFLDSKKET